MKKSNHIDDKGNTQMVDVSNKAITNRKAIASGYINLSRDALNTIKDNANKKGDVLGIAKIAGIQAAKKTSDLVPLTHQINLLNIKINFEIKEEEKIILCVSEVISNGKTGVEIEALLATQISLLTIYDMCKYIDRSMIISEVKLLFKEGGKTGVYKSP
jgi:cyclic pyranopterin monophosphate synthase